jgi:predicted metal-dependent hydrolase
MFTTKTVSVKRSSRRSISLNILPSGELEVRAPYLTPDFFINRFLSQHDDWITKRLGLVHHTNAPKKKRQYTEGEEFLYLGTPHILTFGPSKEIIAKNGKILFPEVRKFRVQKELETWYIHQAKTIITQRVALLSQEMGVTYQSLYFSDTKSKWGSCSHDNNLQFNWRLVMAPALVLNYVVVHELTHITHKNHSLTFWKAVEKYNPSYKQQRKWLKLNGNSLVLS